MNGSGKCEKHVTKTNAKFQALCCTQRTMLNLLTSKVYVSKANADNVILMETLEVHGQHLVVADLLVDSSNPKITHFGEILKQF
jgi:hypothetical protein